MKDVMRNTIAYSLYLLVSLFIFDRGLSAIMLKGVSDFYGLGTDAQVLLIGHSHLMLATDKQAMEKDLSCIVAKYTREGVNVADRRVMIDHYLQTEGASQLKVVVYGVDKFSFTGSGLSQNAYKLFYPFMDNAAVDTYVHTQSDDWGGYLLHKYVHSTRFSDALINASVRGWRGDWSNYKYGQVDIPALEQKLREGKERIPALDKPLVVDFEATLQILTQKGIRVVLVNVPLVDRIQQYRPAETEVVDVYFRSLDKRYPGVVYWDFNRMGYGEDHSLFFDPIHLNPKGQQEVNRELTKRLKAFLYDQRRNTAL